MAYAFTCRSWAENELRKYVTGAREQSVIIALVLGVTDGLDNELLNAYAATGAMHVLAVSGLHVGIIYWLLLLVLRPMNRSVAGKWMLAFISIFVLWSYAFITGLSPSVLRAVTMFSFVALSRPVSYKTNIYNTLAASAFMILWYQPYLIMSVGFQLSYLAVLGIVYLYPGIYRFWEPDSFLARKVWEMTSMSVAAQIATFSLGLLYFHQFPNYFILSNLLVIPGSTLVLIIGLVLLAFSFVPTFASLIGYAITILIKGMNWVVFSVEALPFSLFDNIYINTVQCWLLFLIVTCIILLINYKALYYLKAATAFVVVFVAVQWFHFTTDVDQKRITMYQVKGHRAIDLIDGGHAYFLMDSSSLADEASIRFHIRPNRLLCGVTSIDNAEEAGLTRKFRGGSIISWQGKKMLLIEQKNFELPLTLSIDFVVIGNNAVRDLNFMKNIRADKLILDGSNSFYLVNNLMKQASKQHIDVHSILHQGAFNAIF
jgi:competence protein ComEC